MKVMEVMRQNELRMNSVVVAAKDQISCNLSGEAAILDMRSGIYYGLNQTGAFIWQHIQKPVSINVIKDAMATEYEVDPARCERDLLRILGELVDRGLVEIQDGTDR